MTPKIFENLDPLSSVRENINSNFNDLFNRIQALENIAENNSNANAPATPVEITIDPSNASFNALPEASYYFKINENITTFDLSIGGVSGITFTNHFDPTNFSNCKLTIDITDPTTIGCEETEVYTTRSVTFSTLDTQEAFTFYYFTTGSIIAGFNKATKPPLTPPPPEIPKCVSQILSSSSAFWTQELSSIPAVFTLQDISLPPSDPNFTNVYSTLPGRLKLGYVNTSVSTLPLTIEAVKLNGKYYWTYGHLNSQQRIWSLPYSNLTTLGCPQTTKWQSTTQNKNWLAKLKISNVFLSFPQCDDFVTISTPVWNNGQEHHRIKDLKLPNSPFPVPYKGGFIVGSYTFNSGWVDFPFYCVWNPGFGYRWTYKFGGGPSPDEVSVASQYFPYPPCPTSTHFGGPCVYSDINSSTSINLKVNIGKKTNSWSNADPLKLISSDYGKQHPGSYIYSACLGRKHPEIYPAKRFVAICTKPSPKNTIADPQYSPTGPFHVQVSTSEFLPGKNQPELQWKRVGNTIIVPQEGQTVYLALASDLQFQILAVATQSRVRTYQLKGTVWSPLTPIIKPQTESDSPAEKIIGITLSDDAGRLIVSSIWNDTLMHTAYYRNNRQWIKNGDSGPININNLKYTDSNNQIIDVIKQTTSSPSEDQHIYKKIVSVNRDGTAFAYIKSANSSSHTYSLKLDDTNSGMFALTSLDIIVPTTQKAFVDLNGSFDKNRPRDFSSIVLPYSNGVQCYDCSDGNNFIPLGPVLSADYGIARDASLAYDFVAIDYLSPSDRLNYVVTHKITHSGNTHTVSLTSHVVNSTNESSGNYPLKLTAEPRRNAPPEGKTPIVFAYDQTANYYNPFVQIYSYLGTTL